MSVKKSGCPHCGNAPVETYRPFCSKRCADVDLGKWLGGGYAIPSQEPLGEEEIERVLSEHGIDTDPQ